jgi:hypothetical protein
VAIAQEASPIGSGANRSDLLKLEVGRWLCGVTGEMRAMTEQSGKDDDQVMPPRAGKALPPGLDASFAIAGVKPAGAKLRQAKPVQAKPVQAKPVATKPLITKPLITKPLATKPLATKPLATEPRQTRPAQTKLAGAKVAGKKPAQKLTATQKRRALKPRKADIKPGQA